MTLEFATKWIAYLVGKRKATGAMGRQNGGRCCLGHLAQMYSDETGVPIAWKDAEYGNEKYRAFQLNRRGEWYHEAILPKAVSNWAGLTTSNQCDLAGNNDDLPGFPTVMIHEIGTGEHSSD